ncbi:hypothetical protein KSS87_006606 [Heliosperma pusillum]|nr:hypothetical protein KSS87_006606 [Heliosperma pusillum]
MSRDNMKTISEIKQNENAGYYYTFAKIINLDCTAGWYYDNCKLCRTKCSRNEKGRWKCARDLCDGKLSGFISRVPRFQLKFVVTDASNEEADFMVFDTQISQFITHTTAELLAKIEKAIPRELEAFIDKSFVFKVNIHEKYNVSQGSNSYTVSSMSDDEDLANKWISKYTETFNVS